MAKTEEKKRNEDLVPGPQAPTEVWSPAALMSSLVRGTLEDKVDVLRRSGILDENGRISKAYTNWGKNRITRAGSYEPGLDPAKKRSKD